MWFFTDSDTRARHQYIDASFENALQQLAKPAVISRLGKKMAEAQALRIAQHLKVANLHHGELKLPRNLGNEHVPVVSLKPGEKVQVDPRISVPTPIQLSIARASVEAWVEPEKVDQVLDSLKKVSPSSSKLNLVSSKNIKASVISWYRPVDFDSNAIGKNSTRYFRGRPVFNLNYANEYSRLSPSTIGHELTHIDQVLGAPVVRFDSQRDRYRDALRGELGAYHTQRYFILGLAEAGYVQDATELIDFRITDDGPASTAKLIDTLRETTNAGRQDKFFPNGTLEKALVEAGVDIGIHEMPKG